MTQYDPAACGDRMADVYDEWLGDSDGSNGEVAFLAGLRLRERWGDWRREPLTMASTGHVSVYARE